MVNVVTGDTGYVELLRTSLGQAIRATLNQDDINVNKKRFSVEGLEDNLITGDRIEISTVDGSTLQLVSGHSYPDGQWYVNIDPMGGVKLYSNFSDSLDGSSSTALTLITPSSAQDIYIKSAISEYRPLAKVKEFDFTTSREQIQTETLGEYFKKQYENGLIQGQGTITCFWEHRYRLDDPDVRQAIKPEFSSYLARLILRLGQGAEFKAKLFLFRDDIVSKNNFWYECTAQVSSSAINVPAAGVVETRIEFVTSGEFKLKVGSVDAYLLKEDTDFILKEDGSKIFLEDD